VDEGDGRSGIVFAGPRVEMVETALSDEPPRCNIMLYTEVLLVALIFGTTGAVIYMCVYGRSGTVSAGSRVEMVETALSDEPPM
jgi:hypothetical protein